MKNLFDKLSQKKQQLQNDLQKINSQINKQLENKLNYVNLYMENIIKKEELIDFKELTEANIKYLEDTKAQLLEKLNG